MKKIINTILLTLISLNAVAEAYVIEVSRLERNVYQTSDGKLLIQTRGCSEIARRDRAVLVYDRYSYNNKIIFGGNFECDVVKVISM